MSSFQSTSLYIPDTPDNDGQTQDIKPDITQTTQAMHVPGPGQYFVGGFPAFRRNIEDYKILLRQVSNSRKTTDNENGRLLCLKLLGQEVQKALATKNMSGVFWTQHGEDELVPKLNEELLRAIFTQAKHQFPGFTDSLSDPNCKTVKALDDVCKTAQGLISSWKVTNQ